MEASDMVQVRIVKQGKHLIAEGYVRLNQILWVSRANATNERGTGYIDIGLAEPVGAGVGPGETKPAGPGDTKPAEPTKKKSSGGAPAGHSTASHKSNVAGTVQSSFLSRAAPASAPTTSDASKSGEPPAQTEGSSGASSQ